MKLHGVVNASPDSLATDSIAVTTDAAVERAQHLIAQGCAGIDLGGAGSTPTAGRVDTETEWARLADKVTAIAALGCELSVDTWNPEVMRRALDAGAGIMNAADGLQHPEMIQLAAEREVPVVLPFLSGPDPKAMELVSGDPVETILDWLEGAIARLTGLGVPRHNLILDPGTGFAPAGWEWDDRYRYQKRVYAQLDRLRRFDLPIYVALPWKETAQHDELLDIILTSGIDYGRCHYPDRVLRAQARITQRSST